MLLGVVQGVEIYSEDYFGWGWDGNTIWFVQGHVRNISLQQLKKLNFKVSQFLLKEGYNLRNPSHFDVELAKILEVAK